MSRKDYILIADKVARTINQRVATDSEKLMIHCLCKAFQKDNPLFDEVRFIKACLINSKTNE